MTASHPNYVNASSQTHIAGLVHDHVPLPEPLVPRIYTDTTTPPDEMLSAEKMHMGVPMQYTPAVTRSNMAIPNISPTLLLRRKNRPKMEARISMPEVAQFDTENPKSPPPTEALMSPLPLANKLYAGHTPIVPRARSPLPDMRDDDTDDEGHDRTPEQVDDALSGPLTLPPQPGDGTEDTISLSVLDAELEKLRLEQENSAPAPIPSELDIAPNPIHEAPGSNNRVNSSSPTKSRRHSAEEVVEVVDGVLLKKPRINFGAPLGQA